MKTCGVEPLVWSGSSCRDEASCCGGDKRSISYLRRIHSYAQVRNTEASCPVFMGAVKRLHHGFDDPSPSMGTDKERIVIFRRVRVERKSAKPRRVSPKQA